MEAPLVGRQAKGNTLVFKHLLREWNGPGPRPTPTAFDDRQFQAKVSKPYAPGSFTIVTIIAGCGARRAGWLDDAAVSSSEVGVCMAASDGRDGNPVRLVAW